MYSGTGSTNTTSWAQSTAYDPIVRYVQHSPGSITAELVTSHEEAAFAKGVEYPKKRETRDISPKLYIRYVKSKLGKIETKRVQERLSKLKKMISYADNMGQQALYEELSREIAVLVQEAEMVAQGVDQYLDKEHITKFIGKVKDRTVLFERLEEFPRIVPKKIRDKLDKLKKANTFDEYWIVYVDYTSEVLKTVQEKVREKDPIIFGKLSFLPDRYYFVADWFDKFCDLTLSKLVKSLKEDDPEFELDKHPDLTEERFKQIVADVRSRDELLQKTNSKNYKKILKDLEEPIEKAPKIAEPKRKWWKKWLS